MTEQSTTPDHMLPAQYNVQMHTPDVTFNTAQPQEQFYQQVHAPQHNPVMIQATYEGDGHGRGVTNGQEYTPTLVPWNAQGKGNGKTAARALVYPTEPVQGRKFFIKGDKIRLNELGYILFL